MVRAHIIPDSEASQEVLVDTNLVRADVTNDLSGDNYNSLFLILGFT